MDRVLFGGFAVATGKSVSEKSSLQCLAVFACVRLLTETIASLPLFIYRRLEGGGKERDPKHPLFAILHDSPNPLMTSMAYREALVGHIELWGNHYSYIERNNGGRVVGLWPLRPDHMADIKRVDTYRLEYLYRLPSGEPRILSQAEVLHIRGLSHDGIIGYSPIQQAREAIGLAQAGEEYGARFFGNNSRPDGVLEAPGKIGDPKRLKELWEEAHRGLENAHRVAVLEEGVKWAAIGIPPKDAQFLELRAFQLNEIARLFRIPPHMVGDTEKSTSWGTGLEQQSIGFVTYSLVPRLVRIEQQLHKDLLTPAEAQIWFVEHLVAGLLRGDLESRYRAYQIARQNGWLNADEIREIENMNPIPGEAGGEYWMPANFVVAGQPPVQPLAQGG